jgi:hypothetical protein
VSLRQKVRLEYDVDGKPVEVIAEYSAVDLRAWETQSGKSSLSEPMSISMLTWLGWNAAVRHGLVDGQLKDWKVFDAACTSVAGVRDDPPTKAPGKTATRKRPGVGSSAP